MRSAVELRQRWLDVLPQMMTHPGMRGRDGAAFDMHARGLLADLCFLDEREQDRDKVNEVLRGFGKLGVAVPFMAMFGKDRNCVAEVASVHAAQFHQLGYLQVDRLLTPDEWDHVVHSLHDRFDGRDVRRDEVVAEYGQPSLLVDKRVLCYASTAEPGWVFVDCFTEYCQHYVPEAGRYEAHLDENALVREVRYPAPNFESGLILTRYGKILRWGPGWWLDHPEGLTQEQQAIAAQLRDIESQALRPPRGDLRR